MSQSLWNSAETLQQALPMEPETQFRTMFQKRLDEIPHGHVDSWDGPWIQGYYSDEETRPDHLGSIFGWYSLSLLVDPRLGVLPFVTTENERVAVYRTADVLLRAVDGKLGQDVDEWEIAASTDDLTEDAEWTTVRCAAMGAAWLRLSIGGPAEYLVDGAAGLWKGRSFPRRDRSYFRRGGLAARYGNLAWDAFGDCLFWVFRKLPKGNRQHYFAQARWLLHLMDINWRPEHDDERSMLHELLAGNMSGLSEYVERQQRQWIELDVTAQLPATFHRLRELRRIVRSSEAKKCLDIAEKWAVPVRERIQREAEEAEELARQYEEEEETRDDEESFDEDEFPAGDGEPESHAAQQPPETEASVEEPFEITEFQEESAEVTDFFESGDDDESDLR